MWTGEEERIGWQRTREKNGEKRRGGEVSKTEEKRKRAREGRGAERSFTCGNK